jgi:hypothetical protein
VKNALFVIGDKIIKISVAAAEDKFEQLVVNFASLR